MLWAHIFSMKYTFAVPTYSLMSLNFTQDQPVISEDCSLNDVLDYTVVLKDNGTIIEQRVISSDSCVNGFCETSFVATSSNSYVVHVTATNGIGLGSGTVQLSTIGMYVPVYILMNVTVS